MTLITDAQGWRYWLPVSIAAQPAFELTPGGAIRISGFEVDPETRGRDLVFAADYQPSDIDELADVLKAMAAHARGEI